MKLLRLKITDPKGFRSLQEGFEYKFRNEWNLQEEQDFAPFICAGPNGSGKSNLLEALAAIFYHLECIYLTNLPDSFRYDKDDNPDGFRGEIAIPEGFEIEYLIRPKDAFEINDPHDQFHVIVTKQPREAPKWKLLNLTKKTNENELLSDRIFLRNLLPDYILGYSSGENEILSLPFFKMRFIQFDEYWQALKQQLPYSGQPESRLIYLDASFSQAILLCNLLFQKDEELQLFREEIKIKELKEFRIIIRRSIRVPAESVEQFGKNNPNLIPDTENNHYTVKLIRLLEADESLKEELKNNSEKSLSRYENFDPVVTKLKRCATCYYLDKINDILYLDFYVNEATKLAFKDNFSNNPMELFQALQVLLTLNLYSVSERLKSDLYCSNSLYVSETVPALASDERIMRFKDFVVTKTDVNEPVLLKGFSDGEYQLLHTLGLCLLFKNTQSLFLLDEPETHFNPHWRASFVTRLYQSFGESYDQEMLITTHTPFLISDSRQEKVMVFEKRNGVVSVISPKYNTFGASINKITMNTFDKRETIGLRAQELLDNFSKRANNKNEDKEQLITEINNQLGDSVEKILLIKTILDSIKGND